MKLYLVQHGLALDARTDPARPLSAEGANEVRKLAWALQRSAVRPAAVQHSGKLRAAETAAILAAELGLDAPLARKHLNPKSDPSILAAEIDARRWSDGTLLVGHLPHLQGLTGLLLCGAPAAEPLRFRNAAAVCLERGPDRWSLAWYLVPELC